MKDPSESGEKESFLDSRIEGSHEPQKKVSRNLSEKKRRDKLNIYISELAAMVPSCASSHRRLDKTTVLKMTVNYMKVHNDLTMSVLGNESGLMSSFLASEELGELLDKVLNGFLLVLSKTGDFVFVSKSVEDLLGVKKDDLIGKSVFEVVHPEDKATVIREVLYQDKDIMACESDESSCDNSPLRRAFNFRMMVKGHNGETTGCEGVHCVGYADQWTKKLTSKKKKSMLMSENGDSAEPPEATADSVFLVGVGILSRPSFIRLVANDCEEDEFTSRHSLDGKFLFVDPRSVPITGYLPYEILGTSVYNYIHQDDLSIYSKAHESLMEYGEGKTGCYRILIKGYQWMWARSRSYVSFNHWNSKPEIYCSTTKMLRVKRKTSKLDFSLGCAKHYTNTRSDSDSPALVSDPSKALIRISQHFNKITLPLKTPEVNSVKGALGLVNKLAEFSDWHGNEELCKGVARVKDVWVDSQLHSLRKQSSIKNFFIKSYKT